MQIVQIIFALLVFAALLLPCAKGLVDGVSYIIFERKPHPIIVIIVWLILIVLFGVSIITMTAMPKGY